MKTLIISLCAAFLITGCASKSPYQSVEESIDSGRMTAGLTDDQSAAVDMPGESSIDRRLMVSTAELRLAAPFPDSIHRQVSRMAGEYEGHVLLSNGSRTEIRVPSSKFFIVVAEIELMGKLINRRISGLDVTEEYYDLRVRLENAMKTRERFLALLAQAQNINEIFRVEKELERINTAIDILKGKMEKLSHQIGYSKITVFTGKQIKPGPIGYIFSSLYKGVSWLFVRN